MKSPILTLLVILFSLHSFSQQLPNHFHCDVSIHDIEREGKILEKYNLTHARYSTSQGGIRYIPIKLHWVRNSDGSFSKNDDPTIFYDVMLKINEEFSPLDIQFVVSTDIDFLDNSAYLKTERSSQAYQDYKSVGSPDFVDVWIVDSWINSPASGYGSPGGVEFADLGLQINAHEFGHFLGLAHTFDTGNGIENVARSGANKNCETAGDGICDTEADPYGLQPGQYLGDAPAKAQNTCVMSTNTTDKNGDKYNPPYNNYMSYYGYCGFNFTAGQRAKMNAAYNRYHTNYKQLTTGIAGKPTATSITIENDEEFFNYTPASGGYGIQLEYSSDNGSSWTVMRIKDGGNNKILLTGLTDGSNYKIRSRHLNSYTYSDVLNYTPDFNSYCIPVSETKPLDDLVRIGSFSVSNTSLNNTTNQNESYSLTNPTDSIIMFPGGSYDFNIKINTSPMGSVGYAFFKIWLDENGDGDFDDAGEFKFKSSKFDFTTTGNFTISSNATVGKTRLRIRAFPALDVGGPCDFFSAGETEDYIINIIEDKAPELTTATFNSQTQAIDLSWTDDSDQFGYEIFKSTDGVDFSTKAGEVNAGINTFSDSQILAFTQYGYKVARKSSGTLSNEITAVTANTSSAYCTPVSSNPCAVGYDIKEFSIPDVNFTKASDAASCNNNSGYSNFTTTDTIKITAGTPHTFNISNNNANFPHLSIFIDLNQNGSFEDNEALFKYSNQAAAINTGTFTIPTTAAGGVTTLRVRGYFNPFPDACGEGSYGETEDYAISITGGKQPKVTGFAFTATSDTEAELTWELPVGFSATGIDIQQSTDGSAFTSIGQAAATETSFTLTGLSGGTRYYYRAISKGTVDSEPALAWGETEKSPEAVPAIALSSQVGPATNDEFQVIVSPSGLIDQNDFVLMNATLGSTVIGGLDFDTFLVIPSAEGEVTVQVGADAVTNNDGVGNPASNIISTIYDITAPTVTFLPPANSISNSFQNLSFELSEKATVDIADLTITNGTDSVFTNDASQNTYHLIVKPIADGEVSVSIPADAFTDAAGNGNVASNTISFTYDTQAPEFTISSSAGATVAGPFDIEITQSETTTGFSLADITLSNASLKNFGQNGDVYSATVVPVSDGELTVNIAAGVAVDEAGNDNPASNTLTRDIVLSGLTATLSSASADTVNGTFSVSVATSANTTDLTSDSINVVNGTVANFSGTDNQYSFDVNPTADGEVRVEIPAGAFTDGVIDNLESNEVRRIFDSTSPSADLSFSEISGGIIVDIDLSEEVVGFEESDIQVDLGSVTKFTKHNEDYTVMINLDANGDAQLSIPAGVFTDFAGNPNTASNQVIYSTEKQAPVPVLSSSSPQVLSSEFTFFEVEISLSEDVIYFTEDDFVIENGTVGSLTGAHTSYLVKVFPTSDGEVRVSIPDSVFQDAKNNYNRASNVLERNYDNTPPFVEFSSNAQDTVNGAIAVTATVSEELQDLNEGFFTLRNAEILNFQQTGTLEYIFELLPSGNGVFYCELKPGRVSDLAGNKNKDDAFLSRTLKSEGPAVSLFSSSPELTNEDISVEILLSEPVTGFDETKISTTIGTVSNFSGSGVNYTADITGLSDGIVEVVVSAGVIEDDLGNKNTRSNVITRTVDVTGPTVDFQLANEDIVEINELVIILSEPVNEFNQDFITLTNATLLRFLGSNEQYVVDFAPVNEGEIILSIAENQFVDLAGNPNSSTQVTLEYSRVLGIAETDKNIKVYPNPVSETLFIKGKQVEKTNFFTMNGQKIIATQEKEIDVSGIAAGTYILTFYSADGKVLGSEMILIQK